ncbi:magnesium transporter [Mycolicibacterium sp. 22603]|uniref:magnesium transporter n=1 Tax=Mycolicibacterium sp. 22603 TaxID=3453950 RepID=UPI003F838AFE
MRANTQPIDGPTPDPVLLSELLGRDVCDGMGRSVGRLRDLCVPFTGLREPAPVTGLVVTRHHGAALIVPSSAVLSWHAHRLALDTAASATAPPRTSAEIWLHRDVLDTQVLDVVGRRIARVSDVLLLRRSMTLEAIGVDVGFAGVLRRLGLARLTAHARHDTVAWADLHPTSDRGHAIALSTPRAAVHRLDADGLAELIGRLDVSAAAEVVAGYPAAVAASAVRVNPDTGERVLRALPDRDVERIVTAMPSVHAAQWRARLQRTPRLLGRHLLRSRVWPRRRVRRQR